MTHISKICVAGGAAVALALSTSSAWAPSGQCSKCAPPRTHRNNTKVKTPKVTSPPSVRAPHVTPSPGAKVR
jgi:hypothetical protein